MGVKILVKTSVFYVVIFCSFASRPANPGKEQVISTNSVINRNLTSVPIMEPDT